jgi:hypothetical protein
MVQETHRTPNKIRKEIPHDREELRWPRRELPEELRGSCPHLERRYTVSWSCGEKRGSYQ